jgi:elongation factor P--(R)-beta-lysine ligase
MNERESLAAKRPVLELRALVIQGIRSFFRDEGFLEIQTPLLTPAPAPEDYIDPVPAAEGQFLVTSPELYMKRLLASGYEKIFQITPVFRREEQGRRHHPEFTLLEWYRAGADYRALQEDCRQVLDTVCGLTGRSGGWRYQGEWLEGKGDFQRYTVRRAFLEFAAWDPLAHMDQTRFDLDLVEKIEPRLGFLRPCILSDYPASQAALARLKASDPTVAERFELYWAGIELANGFSELTDPEEQRDRFQAVIEMRTRRGQPPLPLPQTFLACLEHLPPCAGIALGIDRLVMLLADAPELDAVVAFPPHLQTV